MSRQMMSRPCNNWSYKALVVISGARGTSAYPLRPYSLHRMLGWGQFPVLACQSLWWETFMHVFSICQPTGCYALIIIHPFLLWLLCHCLVVLYQSWLKFAVVDVHVYSEIICCRKMSFKTFSYTLSCTVDCEIFTIEKFPAVA